MKKIYEVTFKWHDTETYCSNVVIADDAETVERRYCEKYGEVVAVKESTEYALKDAERRGKPVVKL